MLKYVVFAAVVVAALWFAVYRIDWADRDPQQQELQSLLIAEPVTIPAFTLTNQHQRAFGAEQLRNHWTWLFFGYTHCPDICPTTMLEMDRTAERLQSADIEYPLQYVFVSVDPRRDTPAVLRDFIAYFNPDFFGITGPDADLQALTRPLGIRYKLGEDQGHGYPVDHSSQILLIDPEGRYYARFSAPHRAEVLVRQFNQLRQRYENNHEKT
jgi:protein SCO1/2